MRESRLHRFLLFGWGALIGILTTFQSVGGAGEEDGRSPAVTVADLSAFVRRSGSSSAAADAILESGGKGVLALIQATRDARGAEILKVLDVTLRTGRFSSTQWHLLRPWLGSVACVEARLEGVQLRAVPFLDIIVSVRDVFLGSVTLVPDNTPLRIRFSYGALRGAEVKDTFGDDPIVMCLTPAATGLECREGMCWKRTGLEEDLFRRVAPLAEVVPGRVLAHLQSGDREERWLGAAQAVMTCRFLDGPQWASWRPPTGLAIGWLSARTAEVLDAFAAVQEDVVWDSRLNAFRSGCAVPVSRAVDGLR